MSILNDFPWVHRCLAGLYELNFSFVLIMGSYFFYHHNYPYLALWLILGLFGFVLYHLRLKTPKGFLGLALFTQTKPASWPQLLFRGAIKYALGFCLFFTVFPQTLVNLLSGQLDTQVWHYYCLGALVFLLGNVCLFTPWAPPQLKGLSFYDWFTKTRVVQVADIPWQIMLGKVGGLVLFAFLWYAVLSSQIGFLSPPERAKNSQVKSQMVTLETMLATYHVDHQTYPADLAALEKAAKAGGYWKAFENPFLPEQPGLVSYDNYQTALQRPPVRIFFVQIGQPVGQVIYQSQGPKVYTILGLGHNGELLQENGKVLELKPEQE